VTFIFNDNFDKRRSILMILLHEMRLDEMRQSFSRKNGGRRWC